MNDIGKELRCLVCGSEMVLDKRLKNSKGGHRRRRFKCTSSDCDFSELIHADGERDVRAFDLTDSELKDIESNREYNEY